MRRPSNRVTAGLAAATVAIGAGGIIFGSSQGGSIDVFLGSTPTPSGQQTTNCSPATNATMTNSVSHLCGFADVTNTGVPAGETIYRVPEDITEPTAATGSGWSWNGTNQVIAASAAAVVKNIEFTGNIDANGDGVLVDNVRAYVPFDGMGVALRNSQSVTVEDSEFIGGTGTDRMLVGVKDVYGDVGGTIVRRNEFIGWSTGVQIYSGLIEQNYIHDPGFLTGDHTNGTTSNGGTTQLTIQDNTVLNDRDQTDAISLFEDFGPESNRTIDHNLVAGGSYCIYGGQNVGGPDASNIAITNNSFSRMYYANCGSSGYLAAWPPNGGGGVFSGNIWDDTGDPVSA